MLEFFSQLFDTTDFPQRWHCGNWSAFHGWVHVVSDFLIFGAYTAIPCVLGYFVVRRRDVPFLPIFWLFVAFIFSCGFGHLVESTIFWIPWYRLSGLVKLITAIVSWGTVIALVPIVPRALALPGLAAVNKRLQSEMLERQKAEELLRQHASQVEDYASELEQTNRKLDQFAYVLSHDLQEPLRAVAGCVQVLQKRYQGQLDTHADELIAHAVSGATRMQALIHDVLAYSRVGNRGVEFQTIDANALLKEALANLDAAVTDARAVVTNDPLPTVLADGAQLTQVFQNLLGNAIKFRGAQRPEIHVAVQRRKNEWLFAVRDNGIGIQPEYFDRIFVIFQRLHTRQLYPGTGIGLTICKKVVERHGGRIWVESRPGKGSTFYFTIPDRGVNYAAPE
jgi:signal transduction histidine kinase